MNFLNSAVLIVLLVLLVFLYRPDFSKNKFLAGLRLFTIILFVLIVGGTVWTYTFKSLPRPAVLYLIDRSQSLSLENKESQLQTVLKNNLFNEKVSSEYWGFSDSVQALKNPSASKPVGSRTDIASALVEIKRKSPGSVLLISDGWHNRAEDPVRIAQGLGFPVYTIGLGKEPERDLVVSRIITQKRVYLNDTVRVVVRLQSFGFSHATAKIRLVEGVKSIAEQAIPLSATSSEQEVEFKIVPKNVGHKIYSIVAEEKPGEDNRENNRRDFGLEVLKRKLKVIYLSNTPTPNSQLLKSLFKGEEIEFQTVVAFTNNHFQLLTENGPLDFKFPEKFDCDCLILDNLDATRLDSRIKNLIDDYSKTGGVLVLGGEGFQPAGFSSVLPFLPKGTVLHKEIFLTQAPDGATSPLFYDGETNLLTDVPPFYAANESRGINQGATVLAWDAKSRIPLIGYCRPGKGRILEFSFFPLWRWGFSLVGIGKTVEPFKKFLTNCLYFLSRRDAELFRLSVDKHQYLAGEDINFTLEAHSLTDAPLSGLDVSVAIRSNGQEIPMVERSDGVYEATWPGLAPGNYLVTARALKEGKLVGTATVPVLVLEQSLELLDTGRNRELLKKIAEVSGGKYYGVEELPQTGIPLTLALHKKTFRFEPQSNPFVYLIFVLLFSLELFFRKRKGLP